MRVRFRLERDTITLHEPVVVTFTVRNDLARPIMLNLGPNYLGSFQLRLLSPDGRTSQAVPTPYSDAGGSLYVPGTAIVRAGEIYREDIIATEWLEFRTAGAYLLAVDLPSGITLPDGKTLPPQTASFRVEVKPRDPRRLADVCAGLVGRIEASTDVRVIADAAVQLGYVDDPVAVPYLARVLFSGKGVEGVAAGGLERIANADAVVVLISALASKSGDAALFSREALDRLASRITDPALRTKITRALARGATN